MARGTAAPAGFDRAAALDRFRRARLRTKAMFDLLDPAAYYDRPIALRNPIVFYEGHLPAFAVNTLIKKGLGRPGIDEHLETILDRKSTRLNSSHVSISYAVFCLKKTNTLS